MHIVMNCIISLLPIFELPSVLFTKTVGTSANNVVQLDGSAKLPAVDGSQLTNIDAASAG